MCDKFKQPPEKRSKIIESGQGNYCNVAVYGDEDEFMHESPESDVDNEIHNFNQTNNQATDLININGENFKKANNINGGSKESASTRERTKNTSEDNKILRADRKQTQSSTDKQPVVLKLVKLNSESTSVLSSLLKNCRMNINMIKEQPARIQGHPGTTKDIKSLPTENVQKNNSSSTSTNSAMGHSLDTMLNNTALHGDINKNLLQSLRQKVATLANEKDRYVSLVWGEIKLNASLKYDSSVDKIIGFEDCGKNRSFVFADRALIFMVRWINTNWKLPLSFTFHSSRAKTMQLVSILKSHVRALQSTDLKVVALVCKHNNGNIAAIKMLERETRNLKLQPGSTIDHDQIMIRGMEIVPILDPSHLLKCLRDNFMANDIEFKLPGDKKSRHLAKWSHLEFLRNLDVYSDVDIKGLWRLSEELINEKLLNKSKVENAAKVFSRTCASFMAMAAHYGYTTSEGDRISEEALNTSRILLFVNDIFDSLNGSVKRNDNNLRRSVSKSSDHWNFWMEAQEKLGCMQFVDRHTGAPTPRISCFEYWMKTVDGFLRLWQKLLQEKNFPEFSPRYLNADPLETFFSEIRCEFGETEDPTCDQFVTVYTRLLRSNFKTQRRKETDYDDDDSEVFVDLTYPMDVGVSKAEDVSEDLRDLIDARTEHSYSNACSLSCIGKAGIIAESLLKSANDCATCRGLILKDSTNSEVTFPLLLPHLSTQFLRSLETIDNIVQHSVPPMCYKKFLKHKLLIKLREQERLEWLRCNEHGAELKTKIYDFVINLQLHAFCSIVNKILAGDEMKHIDYGKTNNMFKQARLYRCQNSQSGKRS